MGTEEDSLSIIRIIIRIIRIIINGNNVNVNVSYPRCFSTRGSIALVITNVLRIDATSHLLNKLYN